MAAGKVLSGRSGSLAAAGVRPGAKLMLLAAAGTSSGQAALEASRASRQEALERGRAALAERAAQKGLGAAGAGAAPAAAASMRQRAEAWQKTGIAALRDLQLSQLPAELFSIAAGVRVLDAGGNRLTALPPSITALTALQRLRLSINRLDDAGAAWPALCSLRQLAILAADDNRLTVVPPGVSSLARLQKLSLNGNQIGKRVGAAKRLAGQPCPVHAWGLAWSPNTTSLALFLAAAASLPDSLGALQQLRALALRGNRLAALPPGLCRCARLAELDARDNQLAELPAELGQLTSLKVLLLDNNR